jgi:hypothetical protein
MKLKKDLIIVALATFFLTATLFMIRPTLSNPGIGEYDAWNDLNGDGTIDMYDAINFAGTFNTKGDPTKNVNVTNWLQSEPRMVLYGEGYVAWDYDSTSWDCDTTELYVGDYLSLTVLMKFENANVGNAWPMFSVKLAWTDPYKNVASQMEILTSTLYQVTGSPPEMSRQVSIDSYPIRGPYVQLQPKVINYDEVSNFGGNAYLRIYVHLTHCVPQPSTLKAMNWSSYSAQSGYWGWLGPYNTQGYRQITIVLSANANCTFFVYGSYYDIDQFNYTDVQEGGHQLQIVKTYQVTFQTIDIEALATDPETELSLWGSFYMTT